MEEEFYSQISIRLSSPHRSLIIYNHSTSYRNILNKHEEYNLYGCWEWTDQKWDEWLVSL